MKKCAWKESAVGQMGPGVVAFVMTLVEDGNNGTKVALLLGVKPFVRGMNGRLEEMRVWSRRWLRSKGKFEL